MEAHGPVDFAVVLLTADDEGGLVGQSPKPRARQNVILELGYFVGRLGRSNVCAIYDEGVELPSDVIGVGYVSFDKASAWEVELARELKAAGVQFDATKIL
ncbi:MAG: putative nucleotide-binding containing TIR-like domain protein [Hyphomicrobiales bacterium]|nr:putative nucleotide-binding containing TIR-like domain protein [Hyphomicrobiales bacterium]